MAAPPMTAGDIAEALHRRWIPEEYVHVRECPDSSDRGGRKLDVVVFSAWKSRGFEIDGVEIKVSMADLKREIVNPAKADWWWRHVHRFWVAAPAHLADRIAPNADALFGESLGWPSTWGLLSCTSDKAPTVAIKPTRHTPEPLPWGATVGVLRAAVGCGYSALGAARAAGREEGKALARAEFERTTGDASLRRTLEELREKVAEFERATGIDVAAAWSGRHLGEQVALLNKLGVDPDFIAGAFTRHAQSVRREADQLDKLATLTRALITNPQPQEAPAA
jgi:hypothetical protein